MFKLNYGIKISSLTEILKKQTKFNAVNLNESSYLMGYVCSHKGFKFLVNVEETDKDENSITFAVEKKKLKIAREHSKCLEKVIFKRIKSESE